MKITKENRNIVLYMTIGDGYISKNGYLVYAHSEKQKDYAEWKRKLLIKSGFKTTELYEKNTKLNGNLYKGFEVRTLTYDFIKLYRKIFYTNKKNIANRKILNRLNPLGLAIWYMDDGGLSQKKRNNIVVANDLMLNTYLTKEENQVIIDYFKEIWDISFNQYKSKGKYRLSCGTKEAVKFLKIVYEYVKEIPSMQHKLNIKSNYKCHLLDK
jgi:hypothetical protein